MGLMRVARNSTICGIQDHNLWEKDFCSQRVIDSINFTFSQIGLIEKAKKMSKETINQRKLTPAFEVLADLTVKGLALFSIWVAFYSFVYFSTDEMEIITRKS